MYYTYYIVFCINTVRIIGRHNTADRSRSRAAASCRAAREAENPMLNLVTTPTTATATMAAAAETRRLDIAAMHAKALSIFNTIKANPNVTFAKKHCVDFYENVRNTNPNNRQQMKGNCMCCSREIASTGSFKFTEHLTKCSLCPREVRNAFIALNEKTEVKRAEKRDGERMATEEAQLAAQQHEQRQAQLKQQCIKAGIKQSEVNAADLAIANFFYANAIPFNAASSEPDSLYRKMVSAIQAAPSGYVPPKVHKLAGSLLDESYNDMWAKMHARDPDGTLKSKFGSCYVSDGWESCDNLPLINSAFISANDGGTYWRSVDTSGKTKSAEYCALLMIQDIYDFGPTNVVLVITDTCNTMAKAWAIVQDEFPWISVLPCQPHVIALLMKDIAKEKAVKDVINEEATVVGWFSNHQFPLAKLREATLAMLGSSCELIKAGATRFGTHTLVGERLLKLKAALQRTVVDPDYLAAKYKDATDTEEATGTGRVYRTNKGATTSKLVQDEDGFWARVSTHVDVTKPIFRMLRRFDSSAPAIGKVYSSWFELGEHLGSAASPYQAKCLEKHAERWAYGHSDFAAAAYVLDPEFHEHGQSENEEVSSGFFNVVEKIGILQQVRNDVSTYEPLWKARLEFVKDDPDKLASYDKFPTYPSAADPKVGQFCEKVNAQLTLYRTKKGTFARAWIMASAEQMPAYLWWDANGASCPELQYVARLVLAQPASASICERINSEFAFIKDRRRNKLQHDKANKLVAIFHNLRLLARMNKPNYVEPAVGWNCEDNHVGVIKYGVADYEPRKNSTPISAPKRPELLQPWPEDEPLQLQLDQDGEQLMLLM